MKEHGIPEEGSPETETPPDFTKPPRETFRPLHHTNMNTITLSRPSWASDVYESSFDVVEPKKNPYTPKKFQSYAQALRDNQPSPKNTQQPNKPSPVRSQPSQKNTPTVPATTHMESTPSELSTLTPPSKTTKRTVITPTTQSHYTEKTPFMKDTEQKLLNISRELVEVRNGRHSVITRVAQIEKNQDKFSAQLHDLSKSTKEILARLNEPEELKTEPQPTAKHTDTQHSDEEEFVTDFEFKKFRKKLESVMEDTFDNLHALLEKKFQKIEDRFDALAQKTESPQQSNMDVDSDDEIITESDPPSH